MAWAQTFVSQYGYVAIFGLLMLGIVGPLIPDETILVVAGILIHKGTLHPAVTLAAAYAGSLCGITLSYILGRTGARWLKGQTKYWCRAQTWFERYGRWTLFFGYFVVGVRHFTALVAGSAKMKPRDFALYAWSGGFLWVVTFLSIGYFVGESWERWGRYVNGGILVAAVVLLTACYTLYRVRSR